jgi:hypothetical protein
MGQPGERRSTAIGKADRLVGTKNVVFCTGYTPSTH